MVISRTNEEKSFFKENIYCIYSVANTNIENVNIALTNDLLLLTSCIFYLRTTSKEEKTAQHLKCKQKNLKTFRFRQHKYVSESRHWKKNHIDHIVVWCETKLISTLIVNSCSCISLRCVALWMAVVFFIAHKFCLI